MESTDTPAVYRQESTSLRTAEFDETELARREPTKTKLSRRLLRATTVENEHVREHCLEVRLVYQKKHLKGTVPDGDEWGSLRRKSLKEIGSGEEIQIDLDSAQTFQLFERLKDLYPVASKGVVIGTTESAVISRDRLEELRPLLESSAENREVLLRLIGKADPEALELAALKARHERRSVALDEFRKQLDVQQWSEIEWESFFIENGWMFGHGLTSYTFLNRVERQPTYGGKTVDGRGGERGDVLMAAEGAKRFTVLVEIKTPQAVLVEPKIYRNRAHKLGADVSGGVSQLQVNGEMWLENSRTPENIDYLESRGIYTVQPRGILVVGHTKSLDSRDMRKTFELFRRGLHNPEIVTFDELYERVRSLVKRELE